MVDDLCRGASAMIAQRCPSLNALPVQPLSTGQATGRRQRMGGSALPALPEWRVGPAGFLGVPEVQVLTVGVGNADELLAVVPHGLRCAP